jgi:cytochrome c oxidase subunit 3
MSESTSETAAKPKTGSGAPPEHGHEDHAHGGHGHGHGDGPYLAHHFDSYQQQFDAGKLGIWLFLLTEVLFFAGLFCAYTIYRAMRPEVFVYAHYFLDTKLGALNTCVLLVSSLTAAWAVRNAQLAEKSKLCLNIVITVACACTFMVVKYFEYSHKVHDGLLWGPNFAPKHQVFETESFKSKHPAAAAYATEIAQGMGLIKGGAAHAAEPEVAKGGDTATTQAAEAAATPAVSGKKADVILKLGTRTKEEVEPLLKAGLIGAKSEPDQLRPRNAHVFFSIYFFMTGLHGLHVLIGIGVFIWLLLRAMKGQFGPKYFGPIDYAALYWHLVDLIWIYLFPLLYLIH